MIALTLPPEWAYSVCYLGRRVENRTWRPPARLIGYDLVIHAAADSGQDDLVNRVAIEAMIARRADPAAWPGEAPKVRESLRGCRRSAFVAVVRLARFDRRPGPEPWVVPGQWQWHLDRVRVLTDPLTASGRLGIWNLSEWQADEVTHRLRTATSL